GTELPLPDGIVDARLESPFLFLVAHLEPELDQLRSAFDDMLFEIRRELEEALVLVIAAEAHHTLDPGAVVPAAIKDDDLPAGRKMLHVALNEHLTLLTVGRRRQGDDAEDARAHLFGERANRAALSRAIAAFEDDDDALLLLLDPLLQVAQLRLQL